MTYQGRKTALIAILGFILLLTLSTTSCQQGAPKPAPLSPPAPQAASPAPAAGAVPSADDAAWDKVVTQAKKEGKVTAYTFLLIGDTATAVSKAFEEKYGIKVEFVTGGGAVLLERLKSEQAAKKNIADTLDTAMDLVLTARNSGLTAPVAGDLPVLRQQGVWRMQPRHDPEGHTLVVGVGTVTPFVNTREVKPGEEPKSLRELLAPRWKAGKIALYPPTTNALLTYLYYYREKYGINEDFFRQLMKQEPRIGLNVRESNSVLTRGEASILATSNYAQLGPFFKEGAPLKPIELDAGVIIFPVPGIAMTRDAPHPNATRVFLNWLLSAEGQYTVAKAGGTTPVRNDVPDFGAEAFGFKPRNAVNVVYDDTLKVNSLQTEQVVAKLMGIGK